MQIHEIGPGLPDGTPGLKEGRVNLFNGSIEADYD